MPSKYFLKYVLEKGIVDWLDNEDNRKKAETAMKKANQISSSSSSAERKRSSSKKRKAETNAAIGFDAVKLTR